MAEAKAKVKKRHREAIAMWLKWCKANPRANKDRKFAQFDAMVDSAALQVELAAHARRDKIRAS